MKKTDVTVRSKSINAESVMQVLNHYNENRSNSSVEAYLVLSDGGGMSAAEHKVAFHFKEVEDSSGAAIQQMRKIIITGNSRSLSAEFHVRNSAFDFCFRNNISNKEVCGAFMEIVARLPLMTPFD